MPGADGIGTEPAPRCPACGGAGAELYRGLRDRVFGAPGEWEMRRCAAPECALLWLDPRPRAEEMHKAYRDYYTHAAASPTDPARRGLARRIYDAIREARWQRRFGYLLRRPAWLAPLAHLHPGGADAVEAEVMFLDAPRGPARLLEIGCGNGWLLARMRTLGWEVEGIEFDRKCVAMLRAQGIACRAGDLREQEYGEASFDAIYAGHVLEHVFDPAGFLRECQRVLRPGGRIVLLTPNAGSRGHRLWGEDWRGLEPPRHLQIFNPANLRALLAACGFSQPNVRTTNRGAFYILGMSAAIRAARVAGQARSAPEIRRFSPASLRRQALGRMQCWLHPESGEELLARATKA